MWTWILYYVLFVGFTLLAYVNIDSASGGAFRSYISSMAFGNNRYGAAFYGYEGKLWYLQLRISHFEIVNSLMELTGQQITK